MRANEILPPGHTEDRRTWQSLNRMRTGAGCTKVRLSQWGYRQPNTGTTCRCGDGEEDMRHMMNCRLGVPTTTDDLITYND